MMQPRFHRADGATDHLRNVRQRRVFEKAQQNDLTMFFRESLIRELIPAVRKKVQEK